MVEGTSPDPTLMTIDALRREITMLENLFNTQLAASDALNLERFRRIDGLLDRVEEQRREQKNDTKTSLDAAFAAQKEATAKVESSISELIKSLDTNFEVSINSVRQSISDMKDRLTTLESRRRGSDDQKTEFRQATAGTYATIGIIITIMLAALTIITFLSR